MDKQLIEILTDLQRRVDALENRKPLAGARGPAGDINAALHTVEEKLPGLLESELRRPEDNVILRGIRELLPGLVCEALRSLRITELRGDIGYQGPQGIRGEQGPSGTTPTKELVERLVAKALAESELLSPDGEHAGLLLQYAIEQELLQKK